MDGIIRVPIIIMIMLRVTPRLMFDPEYIRAAVEAKLTHPHRKLISETSKLDAP